MAEDVIPQPSAQLSSTGRPAAEPLTTDHPIDAMAVDRTGRYGVSAFVLLTDQEGWPSRYRIVVAPPVFDEQDRAIGIMDPPPVTVRWIQEQGWILDFEVLLERMMELIGTGQSAEEAQRRDELEAILDAQDATEAQRQTLQSAFEETIQERGRDIRAALEALDEGISNAGTAIKSGLEKAFWWGVALTTAGILVDRGIRYVIEKPKPKRRRMSR